MKLTDEQRHERDEVALNAVAAYTGQPVTYFRVTGANAFYNMLHVETIARTALYIYGVDSGTVYPGRGAAAITKPGVGKP